MMLNEPINLTTRELEGNPAGPAPKRRRIDDDLSPQPTTIASPEYAGDGSSKLQISPYVIEIRETNYEGLNYATTPELGHFDDDALSEECCFGMVRCPPHLHPPFPLSQLTDAL